MESMRVCAGGVPVRPLPNPRLVCEAGVKGWRATPVVAVELLLFPRSSPVPPVLGPGSAVVLMVPPRARKLYVELCCLGAVLLTSFWVPVWMRLPVLWLCGRVARVLSVASALLIRLAGGWFCVARSGGNAAVDSTWSTVDLRVLTSVTAPPLLLLAGACTSPPSCFVEGPLPPCLRRLSSLRTSCLSRS